MKKLPTSPHLSFFPAVFFISISSLAGNFVQAADPAAGGAAAKPKYGSAATLLSHSHEYIRQHAAPDFWALMPYYVPQRDGRACSLATITMVVNAARSGKVLTSEEKLATQDEVYSRTPNKAFKKGVGAFGRGVILDDLGPAVAETLAAYGISNPVAEVVHVENTSKETRAKVHQALLENEKSANDFILLNFDQGVFTGDATAGHISPVAAYDAENQRVLVLDVDREWYEPYWVSEESLVAGMATPDKAAGKNRGFVRVKFQKP